MLQEMRNTPLGKSILKGASTVSTREVINGFMKAIEDDTLFGAVITITPKKGVQVYKSLREQTADMMSLL
jgi:hypothetical protein